MLNLLMCCHNLLKFGIHCIFLSFRASHSDAVRKCRCGNKSVSFCCHAIHILLYSFTPNHKVWGSLSPPENLSRSNPRLRTCLLSSYRDCRTRTVNVALLQPITIEAVTAPETQTQPLIREDNSIFDLSKRA